jgi:2-polyprenyl-6-methoxyphenol hydroxylase-like FAD-dependent oxidoreductase
MRTLHPGLKIAVIGAGPAGLVVAIALKMRQFEVEVFERIPDLAHAGGGLGIQSNGLRVLDKIGVLETLRAHMNFTRQVTIENTRGEIQASMDLGSVNIPMNMFSVLLRTDLLDALMVRAQDLGIPVHFDHAFERLERKVGSTRLHFTHGQTAEADLIVAADGVHSRLREQTGLPFLHRPTGTAYLRLVIERPSDPGRFLEIWGEDGRRCGFGTLSAGRSYMFCSVPPEGIAHYTDVQLAQWLAAWDDFPTEVGAMLRAAPDLRAVYMDRLHELQLSRWYQEPVIFIGDAAHAMTPNLGQGGNSAMTDAWVLSCMLSEAVRAGQTFDSLGRRFEAVRKPFVTRVQRTARMIERMGYWNTGWKRGLREALFGISRRIPSLNRNSLRLAAGYNPREQVYFDDW